MELEVTVKAANGTKSVVNLPVGTSYTVLEKGAAANGTSWDYASRITCITTGQVPLSVAAADRTLTTEDPNQSVTINNDFTYTPPTPGSLVLSKSINSGGTLPDGMDADTAFKFTVTLSSAINASQISGGYDHPTGTIAANTPFTVKLKAGSGNIVTISDLPAGTTYRVEEDTAHYYKGISKNPCTKES